MKRLTIWLILCLLLLIGLYFRWQYATTISLFIDEFTTMWAAQRILGIGLPIMPSGVLYTRGLLSSYVEALFLAIHFSPLVARLPSILLGLLAILTTYMVGRHHFDWRVGLLAAALMTLAPEQIVWSGRARFYIQLQLFVLLAAWAAFESIRTDASGDKDKGWRLHALFALLFILALFSQEETILLYPGIVLAALLWQGWRFFQKPAVFVTHLVCVVAMGVRYAIEKLGQPGYFETIQDQRPYLRLELDIGGALEEYADFFMAPSRIPLTIFVLVAIAVAFYQFFRRQDSVTVASPAKPLALSAAKALPRDEGSGTIWQLFTYGSPHLRALPLRAQATLFYLLLFLVVFSIIVIFVGKTWREMRYIFLLVPFWFLIAAEGALCFTACPLGIEWLSDIVTGSVPSRQSRVQALMTVVLTVAALLLFLPEAQEVLTLQVEGYDLALDYIAEQRQAGDAVLTPQPPSCALILGPCDYYAIQKGYEEYVIQREGQLIDRWSGAPLLDTVDELREVIAVHPNTYFMVDGYRLATRYEPDFIRTIVEQMDVVFTERGISVLRAQGLRALPDLPIREAFEPPINFGNQIGLSAAELSTTSLAANQANQTLDMMLTWRGIGAVWGEYNIFLHLITPDNRIIAQDDGPPVKNLLPTWLFGATPHPDPRQLRLPADTEAGRYRIRVGLYDLKSQARLPLVQGSVEGVDDGWTLDYVRVGAAPSVPPLSLNIDFEPGIQLVSHSEPVLASEALTLSLGWQAKQALPHDYTIFIHLIAPDGTLIAQDDRPPEGGFYPTSAWDIGEIVVDHYTLALPPIEGQYPKGTLYRLLAGLYRPETGERLQRADGGGDTVELGTIEVK